MIRVSVVQLVGHEMFYEMCVLLIFPFCLIYAGITDVLSFTISNKISGVLVAFFFLLAPFSGLSFAEIGIHILVGFVALLIGFVLFAAGYLGGGDVKIIAAIGLWLGFDHLGDFLVYTTLFGGALSLMVLYLRKTPLPVWLADHRWLVNMQTGQGAVPYGIAIGLAGLSVYPASHWLGLG